MNKGVKTMIDGREVTLVLTLGALSEICEKYGSVEGLSKLTNDNRVQQIKLIPEIVALLANQGFMLAESDERISPEWIALHAAPRDIRRLTSDFTEAINRGMISEVQQPEGDTDEVLDEIQKNAQSAAGK